MIQEDISEKHYGSLQTVIALPTGGTGKGKNIKNNAHRAISPQFIEEFSEKIGGYLPEVDLIIDNIRRGT